MYNAHITGKKEASKEIWKWIHLEMWFRSFIDYWEVRNER